MSALEFAFLLIYTFELLFSFIHLGGFFSLLFHDCWLRFDFVLVTISWITEILRYANRTSFHFKLLSATRSIRLLRLIGRLQILRDVFWAIERVIKELFSLFIISSLSFYIFMVLFTLLFGDMYEKGLTTSDYFSQLGPSAFTLFQVITMNDWSSIAREVSETYSWAGILFIIFQICLTHVLLNMIVALLYGSVHELEKLRSARHSDESTTVIEEIPSFENVPEICIYQESEVIELQILDTKKNNNNPKVIEYSPSMDIFQEIQNLEDILIKTSKLQEQNIKRIHVLLQELVTTKSSQTIISKQQHQ